MLTNQFTVVQTLQHKPFSVIFLVVTIYATLGDDALVYGFNEAAAKYVMVDAALLPKLKNLMSELKHVETIIYFGSAKKSLIQEFPESVNIYSLQQLSDIGSKLRNGMYVFISKAFSFVATNL